MKKISFFILFLIAAATSTAQQADTSQWWHGKVRQIHYKPEGRDFVLVNGSRRFNRALYGTHTAFRVEAGDLPEFALYMPGMGGNFKFGLVSANKSKWLVDAKSIRTIYRPGSMLYEIRDPLLGIGVINITVLALADGEGMIFRVECINITSKVELLWVYGGASGKKFSRDGDIGADPESSFYLKPENCRDNVYILQKNSFLLAYGSGKVLSEEERYGNKPGNNDVKVLQVEEDNSQKLLLGIVPPASSLNEVDAQIQITPSDVSQKKSATPAVSGKMNLLNGTYYFLVQNAAGKKESVPYGDLAHLFERAETARKKIADRVIVNTPDPYINTLGGALSIAADAIWEEPSYLHGAVAWRMRLPAWRGPYVADPLGWHDRSRMHFSSYANSQVISPETGPVVADTALHLSRQLEKMGTSLFSSGYISRNPNNNKLAHHYDMNLVYIDELLNHFNWTGDLAYVKQMWPTLQRHLAWEKRNFDADGDGLYDAYAAIWASDALQYSGGGVTHSSAYNYRANLAASEIAALIGEDALPYKKEAAKILQAMNSKLWMPADGSYAEYKDLLGNHLLHPAAALWTVYHAIDSHVPDAFQSFQSLQYIDNNIPHIPVQAKGLEKKDLHVLSTTNWHPYEWSLNNVVLAENQHTALAYWQGGRSDEAYTIWVSSLIESMYLGASPGNFQQLSFYDAIRGELYRDFADGIGMTARALVEGLFGVRPDALHNIVTLQPGWPLEWDHASLSIPDIMIDFKRSGDNDTYTVVPSFQKNMDLDLLVRVNKSGIKNLTVNGKVAVWQANADAVGDPVISIKSKFSKKYVIKITWAGTPVEKMKLQKMYLHGEEISAVFAKATIAGIHDPQHVLVNARINNGKLHGIITASVGNHVVFVQLKQGGLSWWAPLHIMVKDPVEIIVAQVQPGNSLQFQLINNSTAPLQGDLVVNGADNYTEPLTIPPFSEPVQITVPANKMIAGSNSVRFSWADKNITQNIINWNVLPGDVKMEPVNLSAFFNDKVMRIFKNQYLSPRPKVPTLQLPTQGIGEWTHPLLTASIDDNGLRKLAGEKNEIILPQGITFQTPSDTTRTNILFTSQWDNYPKQISIPLSGKSSHAYFLMAGSTDPMQSRITNGIVYVRYTDGTTDSLLLRNPETWWPIEQDYLEDHYAFHSSAPRPVRVHLKTGEITSTFDDSISKYNGKMIDGGAATVLDMPLDKNKMLREIQLQTIANDVVIGLMALTLTR